MEAFYQRCGKRLIYEKGRGSYLKKGYSPQGEKKHLLERKKVACVSIKGGTHQRKNGYSSEMKRTIVNRLTMLN